MHERSSLIRGGMPLVLVLTALLIAPAAAGEKKAKKEPWPEITAEETALKACPELPGASAVILRQDRVDDLSVFETTLFRRVKVLTQAGVDQADIEIEYLKGRQVISGFEARVVKPDGSIVLFQGEPLDKLGLGAKGLSIAYKTAAIPDVSPGCIIDLRYTILYRTSGGGSSSEAMEALADMLGRTARPEEGGRPKGDKVQTLLVAHWDVQEGLFIKKSKYRFVGNDYFSLLFNGVCQLFWMTNGLGQVKPQVKNGDLEIEVENILPIEKEEFMPPDTVLKKSVDIYYFDRTSLDINKFWKSEASGWKKRVDGFLFYRGDLGIPAREAIGTVTDRTEVLKKLYDFVQGFRNLSYEEGMTAGKRKELELKQNKSVRDVLQRRYGLRSDITRTFVALARAAGFEADVIRIAARDDKFFRISMPFFYDQLDSEAALVKLEGKEMLFDPATPFCPFGLAHWSRSATTGLVPSDSPPAFITTTAYTPELALTQREMTLALESNGGLRGSIKETFLGQEALVRRLEHLHDDEKEVREDLESEMRSRLPAGSTVVLKKVEGFDKGSPEAVVEYEAVIPALASVAGGRIMLPLFPLSGAAENPFLHAERKNGVYFPYPFREFNDIVIILPDGLKVEAAPEAKKSRTEFSSYSLVAGLAGPNRLRIQRDLVMNKFYFPVEGYAPLKAFYDQVGAGDEAVLVLVRSN